MIQVLEQIMQGFVAGVGILATGVGLLYLASANGLVVNVDFEDAPIPALQASIWTENESAGVAQPTMPAATATLEPTPTVVPTLEPTQVPTPLPVRAARAYYNQVAPDLSHIIVSLERLSALLRDPQPEFSGWRTEVAQIADSVYASHQRLLWVTPPTEASATHERLIAADDNCLGILSALDGDLEKVPDQAFLAVAKMLDICTDETVTVLSQIN